MRTNTDEDMTKGKENGCGVDMFDEQIGKLLLNATYATEEWKTQSTEDYTSSIRRCFSVVSMVIKSGEVDSTFSANIKSHLLGIASYAVWFIAKQRWGKRVNAATVITICDEMRELHARKNADYGGAFDHSLDEDGLLVAKIRIGDKVRRLENLLRSANRPQVGDESLLDTLIDLACYCVMTNAWIEKRYFATHAKQSEASVKPKS